MNNGSQTLARKAHEIIRAAEAAGRDLTSEERLTVQSMLDDALREVGDEIKSIDRTGELSEIVGTGAPRASGPWGDVFVKSAGFKRIADPVTRGQSYSTGAVEVGTFQTKAGTLLESAQGAGLVAAPQVVPGVVEKLFEPVGVADVIPSAPATTSSVRYVVEGTATSGAAGVPEGAAKPPSDFAYSTVDEPVKKIATSLTTSDEILDDVTSVRTLLNGRLSLFIRVEEERQLLRGGGTNELVGLIGRSGVNTYAKGTVDNNIVALGKGSRTRGARRTSNPTRSSCTPTTGSRPGC